jgi:hypothetical protein
MLDSPEDVCPGQVGSEYPATSVPFSNCQSSGLYGPVGSSQVRLGGACGESGLVGLSCGLWNDRENDHLSKR